MELPQEYQKKMQELLGAEEFRLYVQSLLEPRSYGIRVNTLKVSQKEFLEQLGSVLHIEGQIPWTSDGYYYNPFSEKGTELPGRLPFYHAGLYYIQEPSAMYPAEQLPVEPGDKVLDLCAAPGGKSTKLAVKLQGEGLLVANDISPERVKALIYNIELAGVRNAVVTNETPERLAEQFPQYFDKILVDAPCSGEGMFRKDGEAVRSWGNFKSEQCTVLQHAILEAAHKLLKPGGELLYSTCTFDLREDEEMMLCFLERHPEYTPVPLYKTGGIQDGRKGLPEAARLWPHKLKGEGHFAALLQKKGAGNRTVHVSAKRPRSYRLLNGIPEEFLHFWKANMSGAVPQGNYFTAGDRLYSLPCTPPDLDGIQAPKIGLELGSLRYGKFKPSQQFAMAYGTFFQNKLCFSQEDEQLRRFLRGETLTGIDPACSGLAAVCAGRFTIGFGTASGGILKNSYPKGWRRMI